MNNFDWTGSNWREKYRVRISFFFALIFIWRVQPRFLPFLLLGMVIAFVGILVRQWSAGCVKKNDELARTGPYALVRHPLYLGSFLAAFGILLSATSFAFPLKAPYLDRTLFFWTFLWVLVDSVYLPKVQKEETFLKEKFPGQYEAYSAEVPRFFPKKFSLASLDFSTFSRDLWIKNKEYWSILGYFLLYVVLWFRYYYSR